MSEMKCFRIDDGGERFHFAAETSERALEQFREDYDCDCKAPQVRELTSEEMEGMSVTMEDEEQYPSGKCTLAQLFDNEVDANEGSRVIQLCSTVY
jgi:hypothetical protein